jgi:hypothetical protein
VIGKYLVHVSFVDHLQDVLRRVEVLCVEQSIFAEQLLELFYILGEYSEPPW